MQNTLVDDDHDVVEHAAVPSRPDGVESVNAKLTPMTDKLLVTSDPATFISAARVLTIGAARNMACVEVNPEPWLIWQS